MGARRALRQIDRRAAVRTVDHLNVPAKLVDLLRGQRPDEVLLPQEIDEGRESSVATRAAAVLKPRAPLLIVGQEQPETASRTRGLAVRRWQWRGRLFSDDAEQHQYGSR